MIFFGKMILSSLAALALSLGMQNIAKGLSGASLLPRSIGNLLSRLAMEAVDLMIIRELMGHKTMAMTLRYSHLSPGHRRTAIECLVTRATTVNPEASALAE